MGKLRKDSRRAGSVSNNTNTLETSLSKNNKGTWTIILMQVIKKSSQEVPQNPSNMYNLIFSLTVQ